MRKNKKELMIMSIALLIAVSSIFIPSFNFIGDKDVTNEVLQSHFGNTYVGGFPFSWFWYYYEDEILPFSSLSILETFHSKHTIYSWNPINLMINIAVNYFLIKAIVGLFTKRIQKKINT